jgi:multiple sugar transport system ATP-binding protein
MGDRIAVMNDGLLQQVGPPQELYEHPANRFVAGFIGSPAMNFISADLVSDGGQRVLRSEGFEAQLPQRYASILEDSADGTVTVGFRPEHLEANEVPGPSATLRAHTDVVEFLGNEELLHVTVSDRSLLALVDSSLNVRPGDVLDLHVPLDKMHVFDNDGQAISTTAAMSTAA